MRKRETYFLLHHPNFNHENTHDFSEVFQCMAKKADLFGSAIFKITEIWLVQDELWQANDSLMTLRKGLKFFRAVSPSKSPKVMGLMGIHDLNALLPLVWKGGSKQVHHHQSLEDSAFKLGLMCDKCFSCPSIFSETICHHRWRGCLPSGEREAQTNHPYQHNHQCRLSEVNSSLMGTWTEGSREDLVSLRSPYWG